jgi:hypothetical protein
MFLNRKSASGKFNVGSFMGVAVNNLGSKLIILN